MGKAREWTKEELRILRSEHAAGTTYREIGEMLGVRKETVRYKAQTIGLGAKPRGWTTEELETLSLERCENMKSYKDIANILGRNPAMVANKANEMQLKQVKCIRKTQWSEDDVIALRTEVNKGTSYKEISRILRKAEKTIQLKARELGYPTRVNKWDAEEDAMLRSLYSDGLTFPEIARQMERSRPSIAMRCGTLGLFGRLKEWTDDDISILKQEYLKRTSSESIANMLGRDVQQIRNKACNLGISNPRKYYHDEAYFSDINTQKKAYWLGWLMSDGYIRGNRIVLKLAKKDKCVLEDLKSDIGADNPILYEKPRRTVNNGIPVRGTGAYYLALTSSITKKDLGKYGVVPNKTYTCAAPDNLAREYYPGYIAGLISGDGSISVTKKNKALSCSFCGTEAMVTWVRDVLSDVSGCDADKTVTNIKHSDMLYAVKFSIRQTLRINNWFKANSISLMARKQEIIDNYIQEYPKKCKAVA